MILYSAILGVLGFWSGFALATIVGASPGASVVVMMTLIFLITLTVSPRYGLLADWIRRSSAIPQEVMEDILGVILRFPQNTIPVEEIEKLVTTRNLKIRRAISLLGRQRLIEISNNQVQLTADGRIEANRLVRAHRLWETYLEKTGTPETEVHEIAHKLEHISDQATVAYLDDKLGHPLSDPHGSVIPTDQSQVGLNRSFISSLMRDGNRAVVEQVGEVAQISGLKAGDLVTMNRRSADGNTWILLAATGDVIELNHDQADAIIVRLTEQSTD